MPERTPRPRTGRDPAPLLGYVLLALVVIGAAAATPWRVALPALVLPQELPDPVRLSAVPELGPRQEPQDSEALTVIVVVLALLGALLILTLLYLLARRALAELRDTPEDDDDIPDAVTPGAVAPALAVPELQDAVQLALARVDAAATPHDAVVAAWVALEDAAAEHGHRRAPAQTPTEFTGELLAATPAPPDAVSTLRRLYSEARFTDRPVDAGQVDGARGALRRIARVLADGSHAATSDATPGVDDTGSGDRPGLRDAP